MVRINWSVKCILLTIFLVCGYCSVDAAPPQIVATNPPNGAVGVRPDIDTIQVLFDKPIVFPDIFPGTSCMTESANWPSTVVSVNGFDGLLYHFARTTTGTDLPLGSHVEVTLNPPGAASTCFRDQAGTLLPTYKLSFTVRQNQGDPPVEPQVVSTYPPKGATGVSRDISSVSITFSKPMAETTNTALGSWYFSYGWGTGTRTWSADGKTLTITRDNPGTPLPEGQTTIFMLNWGLSMRFQATDGNVLPEYTYYFTTEGDMETFWEGFSNTTITKIPANPAKGFHWSYYLSVPNSLKSPTTLFVEPNNSGYPALDPVFHDAKAAELFYSRTVRVNVTWNLNLPVLVPVFPRTYSDYIQSMNLWLPDNCNCPELERPDLQLIAMIEDAQARLRSMGHVIERKVFMNGFSASGGFTNGFTMLHPDIIKAAASGGGLPQEYDPQRRFELEAQTGQPIDLRAYFSVPLYLYVGDQDGNYNADLWLAVRQFYESGGAKGQLVVYPGVGHTITEEMWSNLGRFFQRDNTIMDNVQKLYIGYYQRPADPGGLTFWRNGLAMVDTNHDGGFAGENFEWVLEQFANSAESRVIYGGDITSKNIATVVDSIYMGLFNRHAEAEGLAWWVEGFNAGRATPTDILWQLMNGAQNEDHATLQNKLLAAGRFTHVLDLDLDGLPPFFAAYPAWARTWLGSVTRDPATLPTEEQIRTLLAK